MVSEPTSSKLSVSAGPFAVPPSRPTRLPLGRSARRLSYEHRIRLWLFGLALPGLSFLGALVYSIAHSTPSAVAACAIFAIAWAITVLYFFDQLVRPLQTLANVVAALREDDFSFRARGGRRGDALGDLAIEVNALAGMLQNQRSSARDALALLERVIGSMQSPVLAFDPNGRLRLINQAAERTFALTPRLALGRTSTELKMAALLDMADKAIYDQGGSNFSSAESTRWSVSRTTFRLGGVPHALFVLSDVDAALREEERLAWQRLIRVLSHEINNSLTPIQSIAGSLQTRFALLEFPAVPPEITRDALRGLSIIEERAASLNRFLQAYQQLTRLPSPKLRRISVCDLLERVVAFETRLRVDLHPGPRLEISVDPDQLQQLLINLIRNAADAALSLRSERKDEVCQVVLTWSSGGSQLHVSVLDNGPGLTNPANAFVPFYTTKPGGSGIGLALARQIAAAHGGSVTLANRADGAGCVAELHLPLGNGPTA